MPPTCADGVPLPWYSSFYWRIAISFVVLVTVVLVGQSVMVSYLARSGDPFGPGNPNAAAAAIAGDVAAELAAQPTARPRAPISASDTARVRQAAVHRDERWSGRPTTPTRELSRDIFRRHGRHC